MNLRKSIVARNAELDALAPLFNSGYLRIYDGSQPATPETAISTQTLLAELRFGSTAFGASSAGVITANAITSDSSADATGTAAWYRAFKSDGTTVLLDGDVGTTGASKNLELNSTAIQSGAQVDVTSYTITDPMQGT